MLQQILRDMWVDPEILDGLEEDQKQTLFCRMREEQVRRWRIWDQKISEGADRITRTQSNAKKKKNVQFLKGEDGEPWVWVMGEHPDDKSIESILAEEARQKAVAIARQEARQLRKSVEKELTQLIDYKPLDSLEQTFELSPKNIESLEETLELYCTVDELRQKIVELEPKVSEQNSLEIEVSGDFDNEKLKNDLNKKLNFSFIEGKRDVLQDLCMVEGGAGERVSGLVAAWEVRVAARAGDILRGMRARRARAIRDAQADARYQHAAWQEQERKAKEAEALMRERARAAREALRRTSPQNESSPITSSPIIADKPPNKESVIEWFQKEELKQGVCLEDDKKVAPWFHGLISRFEAERVLSNEAVGSFLIRLSERVWGYALSYRDSSRCKHYLVKKTAAGYRLLGDGNMHHPTLVDLVKYHKTVPITENGGELLATPCAPAFTPDLLTQPPS